ncbi:MAG TPA: hypothetical protein VG897_00815 [Terriglobales bacterium]|nr:hypothetical protein [Terriglobales bacterium]
MTHREIALVIALAIPIIGYVMELFRAQMRLRGFSEIKHEVQKLAKGLAGEIDRDAADLLVRGRYGKWPVFIRFSRSEYEAGTSIQISVPSDLTLYCYPVTHQGQEGNALLRTGDERFMSRFRLSTNNSPPEVNMLLSSPTVMSELSKITDSQTYVTLENRSLELAEAVIIPGNLAARLTNCVRGMTRIAAVVTQVHGESESIPAVRSEDRNWFRAAYLAVSAVILVALGVLVFLERPTPKVEAQAPAKPTVELLPELLAKQVPQLEGWQVSQLADFDSNAVAWMQQQGQHVSGHVTVNMDSATSEDSVYILKRPSGPGTNTNRLIVFVGDQARYDAEMPQIAIAGRVSRDSINSVQWRGRGPSGAPNGDGVIVIQRYNDPSSAIVFFVSGAKLLTAVPQDFRTISLE